MNQQDKDNQQLRPFQDFKIGEIVEYAGLIGKVVSTNYHNTHPILVDFNSGEWEAFTKEGCLYGEDVELFRLEESDKPDNSQQGEDSNNEDSVLFQTFKQTAKWLHDNTIMHYGAYEVGSTNYFLDSDIYMKALYNLYKASRHE